MKGNPLFRGRMPIIALVLFFSAGISYADIEVISFAEMARGYIRWNPMAERGTLVVGRDHFLFSLHSGSIMYNYSELLPGNAYRGEGGAVFFTAAAEESLRNRIRVYTRDEPSVSAILIDPGHGGKDPGAIGTHSVGDETLIVQEKNVVMEVCRTLYHRLKEKYPDKQIMLTRNGDTFPSLEERVEMANNLVLSEHEAIIYISVHANASLNKKAKGFEVWYLPPDYRRTLIDQESIEVESEEVIPILNSMLEEEYTTESILLAQRILDNLTEQVGSVTENRGIKEEIWFVVRKAKMPSVLIELGFVTNRDEAEKLTDTEYLQKLSLAIYNGTSSFIDDFESTKGFTE
jgi:N-acetylmuramoyl-L-alanine amidase